MIINTKCEECEERAVVRYSYERFVIELDGSTNRDLDLDFDIPETHYFCADCDY